MSPEEDDHNPKNKTDKAQRTYKLRNMKSHTPLVSF